MVEWVKHLIEGMGRLGGVDKKTAEWTGRLGGVGKNT